MTLAERLAAARTRAAVGPAQSRGVLRLAGKDVRAYLHRMCTQHVSGRPDRTCYGGPKDPEWFFEHAARVRPAGPILHRLGA